jgi:hypothetical protein
MRHVPCAGALWRLPFAGSGHLVAVAENGMPVSQCFVVVAGDSWARPLAYYHPDRATNASPDDNSGGETA